MASAGYVWSQVNKECVRAYTGIQLNPIDIKDNDDESICVYVLFSEDVSQAELFLPNTDKSIVLQKENAAKKWVLNQYELVLDKEYQLKKDNKIIFFGDIEAGHKITNTDEPEIGEE